MFGLFHDLEDQAQHVGLPPRPVDALRLYMTDGRLQTIIKASRCSQEYAAMSDAERQPYEQRAAAEWQAYVVKVQQVTAEASAKI
jgi:hypothetical protein